MNVENLTLISRPKYTFYDVELWKDPDKNIFILRYRWGNHLQCHTDFWKYIRNFSSIEIQTMLDCIGEGGVFYYILSAKSKYPDITEMETLHDVQDDFENTKPKQTINQLKRLQMKKLLKGDKSKPKKMKKQFIISCADKAIDSNVSKSNVQYNSIWDIPTPKYCISLNGYQRIGFCPTSHRDILDWGAICNRLNISKEFIDQNSSRINWTQLIYNKNLSEEFLTPYMKNIATYKTTDIDLAESITKLRSSEFYELLRNIKG